MNDLELGTVQARFADLVWAHAPLPSGELVKLCERELNWKKPTTYTVLRKLCEKGIFENIGGTVIVKMSREDFYAAQSRQYVRETFHGSLPAFIAAFLSGRKLSEKEAAEIRGMIDSFREERTQEPGS